MAIGNNSWGPVVPPILAGGPGGGTGERYAGGGDGSSEGGGGDSPPPPSGGGTSGGAADAGSSTGPDIFERLAGMTGSGSPFAGTLEDIIGRQYNFDAGRVDSSGFTQRTKDMAGRMDDVAGQYERIASGASDPAFEEARRAQMALSENQRQQGNQRLSEGMARQGVGGGSVANNELNRLNTGYDLQQGVMESNLGLQQMGRRDSARQGVLGAYGAQAGMLDLGRQGDLASATFNRAGTTAELEAKQAALQNRAAPIQMMIAAEAARNAGTVIGGGGGGGLSVICTELYRGGDLPRWVFVADCKYGKEHCSADTFAGYHLWAIPLVRWSKTSPAVYSVLRVAGRAWAYHMAYLSGAHSKPNWFGSVLLHTVKPACTVLGTLMRVLRGRAACSVA